MLLLFLLFLTTLRPRPHVYAYVRKRIFFYLKQSCFYPSKVVFTRPHVYPFLQSCFYPSTRKPKTRCKRLKSASSILCFLFLCQRLRKYPFTLSTRVNRRCFLNIRFGERFRKYPLRVTVFIVFIVSIFRTIPQPGELSADISAGLRV